MRPRIANVVLVFSLAAVVGGSVGLATAGRPPAAGGTTTARLAALTGRTASAAHGVDALPGGRWSALPAAPIVGRDPDVAVWTGTTMLVWGGLSPTGSRDYADGATYDPRARTWTRLPRSPLTARSGTAWAWTGRILFIWGGTDSHGRRLSDGARYDPRARRWLTLPSARVSAYGSAQAVWTGRQVVLLTTPPGSHWGQVDTRAYDPATGRWGTWATLRLRTHHDGMVLASVAAAGRVYAWSHWAHSTRTADGYETTTGIDGYTLTPAPAGASSGSAAPATWSANRFTWRDHDVVDAPIWTGREIVAPASQLWCGFCPGPYQPDSAGSRLNPATGTDRSLPHGPADDRNGDYVWTGTALLAADTQTATTGAGPDVYPGQAAYWRPSTNRWTLLPPAPLAGAAAAVVWTGRTLLIWGSLAPVRQRADLRTAGLQLG